MSRIKMIVALLAGCITVGLAQNNTGAQSPGPPRPSKIRVSVEVMNGLVEHRAVPQYPDEALAKGIQGDVIFKIDVDETGKIVLAAPVEGDPLLAAASVEAMRDFRFRPYLLNRTPVGIVETQLGYHFSLDKTNGATNGQVEGMSRVPYRLAFRTGVANDKNVLVLSPRKVSGVKPQLPPELAGKPGSVYLTVTIGEDGKVQDVKVVGGDAPFVGPVVAAVKQDVYEPQLVDGKPSVATTQTSFHFGPKR
jgi:TonB family protein